MRTSSNIRSTSPPLSLRRDVTQAWPKCCDEEHDLKNITVDVANQNEKEAIARVVGMVATHDFDMQSKVGKDGRTRFLSQISSPSH